MLQVYKAMLKGVNPVAVKVLRDQSYTSRDEFGKEVGLLKTLHNSNIVQFQVRCPCASQPCCRCADPPQGGCRRPYTTAACDLPAHCGLHMPPLMTYDLLCRAPVSRRTKCCSSQSSWMVRTSFPMWQRLSIHH
jgi:hypothetical protein